MSDVPGLWQHHRVGSGSRNSPNPGLSLKEGAIEPWTRPATRMGDERVEAVLSFRKDLDPNSAFVQLSRDEDQQAIIEGKAEWSGVRGFFEWMETKKYKLHVSCVSLEVPRIHCVRIVTGGRLTTRGTRRESWGQDLCLDVCASVD